MATTEQKKKTSDTPEEQQDGMTAETLANLSNNKGDEE